MEGAMKPDKKAPADGIRWVGGGAGPLPSGVRKDDAPTESRSGMRFWLLVLLLMQAAAVGILWKKSPAAPAGEALGMQPDAASGGESSGPAPAWSATAERQVFPGLESIRKRGAGTVIRLDSIRSGWDCREGYCEPAGVVPEKRPPS
jgi:hypothetical protein